MTASSPQPAAPTSTYRVQLSSSFTLADAEGLIPYLRRLGISHLYLSPVTRSRGGSTHGYDVADPTAVDEELGGRSALESLAATARDADIRLLLDIVPNHMATSPENGWWNDLLRHGRASLHAPVFDVEPRTEERILLPVLGAPIGEVLESGELAVALERDDLVVRYHDRTFPLDPSTWSRVLIPATHDERLLRDPAPRHLLTRIVGELDSIPPTVVESPAELARRRRMTSEARERLGTIAANDAAREAVERALRRYNDRSPEATERLERLLEEQPYRLAFWRVQAAELNYRRFFDIADLVGVRQEEPDVFAATHSLILDLVRSGVVHGLRIDHIDGLHDPQDYLRRLEQRTGGAYTIVEKILAPDEQLPSSWATAGTSGYEFAAAVDGLLVDPRGLRTLGTMTERITGVPREWPEVALDAQRQVLRNLFGSEVSWLVRRLDAIARAHRHGRDLTHEQLRTAIVEVTANLSVYRTYIRGFDVSADDAKRMSAAVDDAAERAHPLDERAIRFLGRVLLLDERDERWLSFVMRWQQLTGAVTAKGVEDTALYRYNRLLSLNEVGGEPGTEGSSVEDLHRWNAARLERSPGSLNATSTHDTKRGEDVRARLAVLSEIPRRWQDAVNRWMAMNRRFRTDVDGRPVPEPNEELHLYQAVVGAWPTGTDAAGFTERIEEYAIKAAREAKIATSWIDQDERYEDAIRSFVRNALESSRFSRDVDRFVREIAFFGMLNSLSQVLLKVCSPGIPDVYQGSESWNLSLVDPDNRRSVDFSGLDRRLRDLQDADPAKLVRRWQDGNAKLFVTARALAFRRENPELFARGDYIPIRASGRGERHIVSFARRLGDTWAMVVVPRHPATLVPDGRLPVGADVWRRVRLDLPDDAPDLWRDVLTGSAIDSESRRRALLLSDVLDVFPIALLASEQG